MKTKPAVVADDQQRYLMYAFYNIGYYNDPNFSWTSIETAIKNGCNGVQLCIPWDEIYPTRTSQPKWSTLDKQIERIVQLGAKVALRIGVHRDIDRVDDFWTSENGVHTYKNEVLYKAHARMFSMAYQPTVDLASDFVRQVAQRYSDQQKQGNILFMSVTNSPFLEQEYSATSMELYQAGETSTVTDYSSAMIAGFRTWLIAKYTTITALNTAWGSGYARFTDILPTGMYASDIYAAFVGKAGKDWYAYRHKAQKAFIDQTTQVIKSVDPSYKVINEHGSVFDNYSVFRGTLGFKNYALNTDGVKVNDSPYFLHRFSMDLVRSNISTGKWVMNEVDGQGYDRIGLDTYTDQVTQSFQHGAKVVVLANFADAGGLEYVKQITQRVRAQGYMDKQVPDFAPNGTISVKLSKLIDIGYSELGIPSQWTQIYNQNGNQPVRITIDEDVLNDSPVTTTPPASTTTAPPTSVSSLSLVAPTVDCSTGTLTFKTAGGDGTPIEYMAVGLKNWSSSATAYVETYQRIGVTFALKARQSGIEVTYNYTTNCSTTPANKPPVLVTPVANQTVIMAQSYSLAIPAATFTDPDGQIVSWAASNLPDGLSFDAVTRTISGTATGVGTYNVSLVVTDNAGATAQTAFTIKVVGGSKPVTPPVSTTASSLSLLAPTLDCTTGALTFKTAGGDGTAIEYSLVGVTSWSTTATLTLSPAQRKGVTFTLKARQSGREIAYDYTTACPNLAPVLVSPVATQTVTVGTSYSFVVPTTTFADSDGTITSWAVTQLTAGLSYDPSTRTISGTPTAVGSTLAKLTVTDNNGATAQQNISFIVVALPATTPTPTSALSLVAPGYDCVTGKITFRSTGGDGTPIEYMALGIKSWSKDSVATVDAWLREGVSFTLQARQSGKQVSYTFKTVCAPAAPTPVNKPPVVVTAIGNQTATLGRSYSYVIPAATFTDPDGQLVSWTAANLPVGLTFDANTHAISGTPSLIGPNVVTITVTDNAGGSVQTTFIFQVLGNNTTVSPPVAGPLTVLAPTFDCTTGKLVFKTSGGDGTLIEFFAVGIKSWSKDSVGYVDPWQREGVTFTLQARQSGKQATYSFKTTCLSAPPATTPTTSTTATAVNKPPVVASAISSQTATLGRSYSYVIPAATFTDPDGQLVSWTAANLPVGLTFDVNTHAISGTPSLIGPNVVTITVTDNAGGSVQTTFIFQVLGNNITSNAPPVAGPLTVLAPTFDCTTGKLVFRTSGGDGTLIEFFAVGIKSWSKDSVGYVDPWQREGVTFTLQARQSGKQATADFKTTCLSAPPATTPTTSTTATAVNKPPVVASAISSQTATLGRSYSYVIPAATFTDPDGQLVSWTAANLPVGLTFDVNTHAISGTPSLIGPNVVTITVTDNAGGSVQTTFIFQVLGSNTTVAPPVAGPLTVLAPAYDCTTGKLIFRASGGDGTLIEYMALGIKAWSSDSVGYVDPWQRNGINFTLKARQSGKEVLYNFTTTCSGTTPPTTTPPVTTPPVTTPVPTISTLVVASPQNRIVYQRNQANQANVPVMGQAPSTATRAEARLVPVVDGQGTLLDWTNLPLTDAKTFSARLTHIGGWYRLEVRAWNGSTLLGQQTVDRVGIGEVFVIAGQSNAYGGFEVRPGANDDRVSCVDYLDNNLVESALPVQFSHMDLSVSAGPNNPKHIWPELGDKLTSRLNVPVLFLGAAQSSTTSDQWRQSADGSGSPFPSSFPYRRLGATILHYIARTGARAVLWHQGEGDQGSSTQKYVDNLTTVINKSRQQTGAGTLPWVMSRTSYVTGITDPNVIGAQNRLINEVPQVFAGPETDVLGAAYRLVDNVHIAGIGAARFVDMWDQSLNADFFSRSAPFSIGDSPQITTGYLLPSNRAAGQPISVPYIVTGNPDATSLFSVQLIRESDGAVVATLGSGRDNPITVTLPGNLANGSYRAKVVAANLTSLAGEPFRVGPSSGRLASPETEATSWQVWPNPVDQELTVSIPATVTINKLHVGLSSINGLNQEGAIGSTRIENGQLYLTLPKLQTGLYFLHIYDGDKPLQTLKVLKR